MAEELVLVANSGDGTISTFQLDTDAETLTPLAVSAVGKGCSTFAVDAERNLVHAGVKGDVPGIVTLALDRDSGRLESLGRIDVEASMTYLTLTSDGGLLLGASYGGGLGRVWRVVDGEIGEVAARIEFPNLHCCITSPDDRFAYFVSLGADLIAQYSLADDGTLTPLDPATIPVRLGAGARHLTLDAEGVNAYLITEYGADAMRFSRDAASGVLEERESVVTHEPTRGLSHSRFGADPAAEHLIWGADVHVADGYLLCSERTESTLASVELDADGTLGEVVAFTDTELQPRGFNVAGDRRHVLVVGERSTELSLLRLEDDGSLTQVQRVHTGEKPNWVRLLAL